MPEKADIALIGCGLWGRNIARNLCQLGALAAVSDHHQDRAAAFAETFDVAARDFSALLADPAIRGLAIVTAAPSHAELAIAGLEAGKHVFIEKPLALSLAEAEAIAAAARLHERQVMAGHLLRYHPAFIELAEAVASGAIGDLRHIRASRLALGRIRKTESVLHDLCPHDLAMINALVGGALPQRVSCQAICHVTPGVDDMICGQLEWADGRTATLQANWLNPVKIHNLTVVGTTGALVFDDTRPWAEKLMLHPFTIDSTTPIPEINHGTPQPLAVTEAEPLRQEISHFLAVCRDGIVPRSGIEEALFVQQLLDRLAAAITQGAELS